MSKDTFPVMEIFGPTIQGEGPLAGQTSHFVRYGGCGYRCSWCDSMHAVDPVLVKANRTYLSGDEIAARLCHRAAAKWVTFSGGDPCMHDLSSVIASIRELTNLKISVETQGQLFQPWLLGIDQVVVSPKAPSSGMADKIDYDVLGKYFHIANRIHAVLKIVCFTEDDLRWAKALWMRYRHIQLYLSVGTKWWRGGFDKAEKVAHDNATIIDKALEAYRGLIDSVLADPELHNAIVFPQLHVLVWGHKQGV